jgi:hypothetical protein
MVDHRLFFLDADGRLVGPESAPFPGETRILDAALVTLRKAEPEAAALLADRAYDRPPAPVQYRAV